MSQNVGTKLLNSFRRPQSSVRLDVLVRSISLSSHIYRATSESKEKWSEPLNFVDGKRVDPCSQDESGSFFVVEPASGNILCEAKSSGKDEVDRAVRSAREAFDDWSEKSGLERGKILRKAADIIRKRLNDIATVETIDSGKPLWEARGDIEYCADTMDYYAGLAPSVAGQHIQLPSGSFAFTRREPLGVVGGIGAWNFPFQVLTMKLAPALACGNTFVYKPSPLTPLTTVMMAEIFMEAGLPPGVFNVVQGVGLTGHYLSSHPDVDKMTFTGSVQTGKKIMNDCADGIKHITLELGGKSPLIVFADADLENAAKGAMAANFYTQGEVCSNATRVFVEESVKEEFLDKVVSRTKSIRVGDPMEPQTQMGALISSDHLEKVLRYVQIGKDEGAKVLCGGKRLKMSDPKLENGLYMSPCVLSECTDEMTVVKDEIFGPVMSVLTFKSEDEAIKRANNTFYGLASGVFTRDLKRAHRVSAKLQAGVCWVNTYNLYPPELPFGGYKMSGIGREGSQAAMDYYTQLKTVYVEMNGVDSPF